MSQKRVGADSIRALWEKALDTFKDITSFDLEKAALEDRINAVAAQGYDDTALKNRVQTLETTVDAIPSSVDTKVNQAVADLVGGAPAAYDTLKEISDYITSDGAAAADLAGRISALETAEDQFLTAAEVKTLCQRVTEEVVLSKYIVANKDEVLTAINKIEESGSITLEEDIDLGNSSITIPAGKEVTINLGDNQLLSTAETYAIYASGSNVTINGGEIQSPNRIAVVSEGGTLTLNNTSVTSGDVALSSIGTGSELIIDQGTQVNAQEMGALAQTGATITMNDGIINATDNAALSGNGTIKEGDDRGHVTINFNGGTLNGNISSIGYSACGIYMPNSGTVNVTGGTINATKGCGVLMRAGTLNITGGTITATDPTGEGFVGKVGDSRVVVPCAAVVLDEKANYPGLQQADGALKANITGGTLTSAGDLDDVVILSDHPENVPVTRA